MKRTGFSFTRVPYGALIPPRKSKQMVVQPLLFIGSRRWLAYSSNEEDCLVREGVWFGSPPSSCPSGRA